MNCSTKFTLNISCRTNNRPIYFSIFTGNFTSESDFRIDGSFEGNIETKGNVVIGKNGKIDGTIVCSSADIEGKFSGTIHVEDLLSIRSSGEVQGDVVMSKLIVESGAVFNAKSSMQNDTANIAQYKKISWNKVSFTILLFLKTRLLAL
jgi:cytoskeletal protein CcmA (bactofilin family)